MPEAPRPRRHALANIVSLVAALVAIPAGLLVYNLMYQGEGGREQSFHAIHVGTITVAGIGTFGFFCGIIALCRRERLLGLTAIGLVMNLPFVWVGADMLMDRWESYRNEQRRNTPKEEMERIHVSRHEDGRLLLVRHHEKEDSPADEFIFKTVGEAGPLLSFDNDPHTTSAIIAWPAPRIFELTILFESDIRTLKLDVAGMSKVRATADGEPLALPAQLPPGKHRVVITANFP
jgi:hypothetical protein